MAQGVIFGQRFAAQVWNFFASTFRADPRKFTKRQALSQLKKRGDQKARLYKVMLKDGKASKFWKKSSFFEQMKDELKYVKVKTSKRGNQYLSFKWTKDEKRTLWRNRTKFRTGYSSLIEKDSPHTESAARNMLRRMTNNPRLRPDMKVGRVIGDVRLQGKEPREIWA